MAANRAEAGRTSLQELARLANGGTQVFLRKNTEVNDVRLEEGAPEGP
jgi:hypothetical protein